MSASEREEILFFLKKSADCRELATSVSDVSIRERLLLLAEEYLEMANRSKARPDAPARRPR